MSTRPGEVRVASPGQVYKALAGVSGHHLGIPEEHLTVESPGPNPLIPRVIADDLLKPGDTYVGTLDNWMDFLVFNGLPADTAGAIAQAFIDSRKATFAMTLFGYIPLAFKVPGKGKAMAFSPHGKIVLNGHYGATAGDVWETWSASMSYDVVGADVGAMPPALATDTLEAIFAAWRPVFTNASGFGEHTFPLTTWFDGLAYYRAQGDGSATGGVWQRLAAPNGPQPGVSTLQPPLQVATVVTLDGLGAKGGRFGRFYLPGMSNLENGLYPQNVTVDLLGSVVQALGTVNGLISADVGSDVELIIASGRGSGENRPVREVKVGRVPDTMRSRRRSLSEDYQALPFQAI